MAGKDAGVEALCPGCGTLVLQKAMIPVLAEGGGVAYLCRDCARRHIDLGPAPAQQGATGKAANAAKAPAPPADTTQAEMTRSALTVTRVKRTPRPNRPLRARTPRAAS